jgi:hypothetical protein
MEAIKIMNEKIMSEGTIGRRSFMKRLGIAGAAAALPVGTVFTSKARAGYGSGPVYSNGPALSGGDVAILRFLAAAELIEADLWTQYAELGGIGDNPPVEVNPNPQINNYQLALSNLDGDATHSDRIIRHQAPDQPDAS